MVSKEDRTIVKAILGVLLLASLGVGGCMGLVPWYSVYQSNMAGRAILAKAEHEKLVLVETAKAEVEAARLHAQAIELVGEASKKFPEYRHQQFIAAFGEALKDGDIEKLIFVPTEANIPIVEPLNRR